MIFTFIPLALMAGGAYFRARTLLREQAVAQSQNLLGTQLKLIEDEVNNKEEHLQHLIESSDFTILIELALHANPQSAEFRKIRESFIKEFQSLNAQADSPAFNQFILLDSSGNIKISSNTEWQGLTLNPSLFAQTSDKYRSKFLYGASPLYKDQFILVTTLNYQTDRGSTIGTLIGITEKENLQSLIQPLNGLSPLADAYFILPNNQIIYSDQTAKEFVLITDTSASQSTTVQESTQNRRKVYSQRRWMLLRPMATPHSHKFNGRLPFKPVSYWKQTQLKYMVT
ncbi:MAG: cache domain-containing protein [Anaerolineales bacterium]|nr:cache domain-containing protein [Anaerolineales bacterium]